MTRHAAWLCALVLLAALGAVGALPARASIAVLVSVLKAETDGENNFRLATESEAREVTLIRDDTLLLPRPELPLEKGDQIETGPTTAALLRYTEGHEVLLTPNTQVKLGSVRVLAGEVLVRPRGAFRVETGFLAASATNGEFLFRADAGGERVELIVSDGAVVCESKGGLWSPVRVAAAERLNASAVGAPEARGEQPGDSTGILFRGPGNSQVQKLPARGFELARIQRLARQLSP